MRVCCVLCVVCALCACECCVCWSACCCVSAACIPTCNHHKRRALEMQMVVQRPCGVHLSLRARETKMKKKKSTVRSFLLLLLYSVLRFPQVSVNVCVREHDHVHWCSEEEQRSMHRFRNLSSRFPPFSVLHLHCLALELSTPYP